MLRVMFEPDGWEDYEYWQNEDRKTLKKVNQLIKSMRRSPFEGTGKPEPLSGPLNGYWSRRINKKDRIVYRVVEDRLEIIQCRLHYDDK